MKQNAESFVTMVCFTYRAVCVCPKGIAMLKRNADRSIPFSCLYPSMHLINLALSRWVSSFFCEISHQDEESNVNDIGREASSTMERSNVVAMFEKRR